jgi:hypothetical protein
MNTEVEINKATVVQGPSEKTPKGTSDNTPVGTNVNLGELEFTSPPKAAKILKKN